MEATSATLQGNEIPVDFNTIRYMPRVTMGVVAGIFVGALVGFSSFGSAFILHARSLLSLHVWVLVTYPFVDSNIINIAISLLSIPIFGKLLEDLYGSAAYARYLAVTTVATGVVCAMIGAATPMITSSLDPWFDVYKGGYYGLQPIMMASFVALKQAMPEAEIALAFVVRVRLKTLPALTLALTLCAAIVLPSRGALPMAMALPVSWMYLRFFSSLSPQGGVGDMRDSFSLASFVPVYLQGFLFPVSRLIDSCSCWPSNRSGAHGPYGGSAPPILPVIASAPMTAVAREHRAIGADLINKRLESLDRSAVAGTSEDDLIITFDAADESFVDVTPTKAVAAKSAVPAPVIPLVPK